MHPKPPPPPPPPNLHVPFNLAPYFLLWDINHIYKCTLCVQLTMTS